MSKVYFFLRIVPVLLLATLITCSCRPDKKKGLSSDIIDSLILGLDKIQADIGSPDIQRLNEFYEEIRDDLTSLPDSVSGAHGNIQTIQSYRQLDNKLNSCLQSCSRFHEEAFLIESSLEEITSLLEKKQENRKEIETRLHDEAELLADLKRRVDSTRALSELHIRSYYELKPLIDSLIEVSGSPGGNHE